MEEKLFVIAVWIVPMVLAITLHEAAHGYVARFFGDPTAHLMGRITLNPFKHIDRVGTILIPGLILLLNKAVPGAGFPLFGWAKPVPVNFSRLRNPKADMLWVAAAGPASNLLQLIAWALMARAFAWQGGLLGGVAFLVAVAGIQVNFWLMLINLLPIPPLDGGRIAVSLLPERQAIGFSRLEPYGFFILIAVLYSGVLDDGLRWIWPVAGKLIYLLSGVRL